MPLNAERWAACQASDMSSGSYPPLWMFVCVCVWVEEEANELSAYITVAVRIMACHIMYYGVFYLHSIKTHVSLACAYKLLTKWGWNLCKFVAQKAGQELFFVNVCQKAAKNQKQFCLRCAVSKSKPSNIIHNYNAIKLWNYTEIFL